MRVRQPSALHMASHTERNSAEGASFSRKIAPDPSASARRDRSGIRLMQDEIAHDCVWTPVFRPRRRTENTGASGGLILQCGSRLVYAVEISIPGTMQQHDIG